jgi:nucleoside-diphosphate-sugar epimerase
LVALATKACELKILVTGANGLVGRAVGEALDKNEVQVIRAVRSATTRSEFPVSDLDEHTSWDSVLGLDVDIVVHLAAKVALIDKRTKSEFSEYHRVNTLGTANLARQCASHGVRRLVYVSTVKVLGEGKNELYQASDLANPEDAYALSKWEAEQALWQISKETGMEVVIIRPPLVYGPGVKANFLQLMRAIDKRLPLPLGAIHNNRSLIYLGNLVDAISLCLTHPNAAGKTYMVSDNDDVSTPELIRRVAKALDKSPFLLPISVSWMRFFAGVLGKASSVDRLVGSFAVDIAPIQKELGWTPPYSMQAGLYATAEWYQQSELSK